MLPASNRSVLYSTHPLSPSEVSSSASVRSNFAVPVSAAITSTAAVPSRSAATGAFCRMNITWNSGLRLISRRGATTSTSFSNGTAWCA